VLSSHHHELLRLLAAPGACFGSVVVVCFLASLVVSTHWEDDVR
jgi:hypothetical protein